MERSFGDRRRGAGRIGALVVAAIVMSLVVPASAATLAEGVTRYTPYAVEQIDAARAGAERLLDRVTAQDAAGAQRAWIEARAYWERAETFTASLYPDLDDAIDAWPDATAGFHAIEAKLFAGETAGAAPIVQTLVDKLRRFAQDIRVKGVTAQGLLDGTTRLAFEIGEKKGEGGESAASGTSLDDMRHNLEGVEMAYTTVFAPALRNRDAKLADRAGKQLADLKTLLQVPSLKSLDQVQVGKLSEQFAVSLQTAAPKLGLKKPSLED